jgi:hypothetical protein
MPRFSDIFVFSNTTYINSNETNFENCRLLKAVGTFPPQTLINSIVLDISGMFLLFVQDGKIFGPYPLTTV